MMSIFEMALLNIKDTNNIFIYQNCAQNQKFSVEIMKLTSRPVRMCRPNLTLAKLPLPMVLRSR